MEPTRDQIEAGLRFLARTDERRQKIGLVERGERDPFEVDDPIAAHNRRVRLTTYDDANAQERILGASDLMPVNTFDRARTSANAVALLLLKDPFGRGNSRATGFMIAPGLLMTNWHVLKDPEMAVKSLAGFGFEIDLDGIPTSPAYFRLAPDRFFQNNEQLDCAVVAVDPVNSQNVALAQFGHLPLDGRTGKILIGEYVSIIQHPNGEPKQVALRENRLIDRLPVHLHYQTDTQRGSSGSPVFNDQWEVVALHARGVPRINAQGELINAQGEKIREPEFVANEGVRISEIVKWLRGVPEIENWIDLGEPEAPPATAIIDTRPNEEEPVPAIAKAIIDTRPEDDEPVPAVEPESPVTSTEAPNPQWATWEEKTLPLESYQDRRGFDPFFLGPGFEVYLPLLNPAQYADVFRDEDGQIELKYHHFSVAMSKSRQCAYFTAVNIDGAQSQDHPRGKDVWYTDPRLPKEFQTDNSHYKKNHLDRGHLVRRLDPVWGELAEEAERDTFHFTNCSLQHAQLNQREWNDLEEYILQRAREKGAKVIVMTGPVFSESDVPYRGTKIPAEFWKVVATVHEGKVRSAGYLLSQRDYLGDLELAYGAFRTYQVSVHEIERKTGLEFGGLRRADPRFGQESTGELTRLNLNELQSLGL